MRWLQPLAWIGLLSAALPIILHLKGTRRPRRVAFPSLHFVGLSPPPPARRVRITDAVLLVIRVAVLAMAVAALARPVLDEGGDPAALATGAVRAIIVDASASTQRVTRAAKGRAFAESLAAHSDAAVVLPARVPREAIAGAASWLAAQHGRRELVVVTDCQRGVLVPTDVARVDASIAVQVTCVERDSTPLRPVDAVDARAWELWSVVARGDSSAAAATWRAVMDVSPMPNSVLPIVSRTVPAGPPRTGVHRVVVSHPGAARDGASAGDGGALTEPWMGDLAMRVGGDAMLARVARTAAGGDSAPTTFSRHGDATLLVASRARPGTFEGAAVYAALLKALEEEPDPTEADPMRLSDSDVVALQRSARTPRAEASQRADGAPVAPWLWGLALVLLGIEQVMRARADERGRASSTQPVPKGGGGIT